MRFWFIDAPAILVTGLFWAYGVTLAAMALLCWGAVIYSLLALWQGWPAIW